MTQKEVRELLNKMSLEEKVAQLYGTRIQDLMEEGKISEEKCKKAIPYGAGHVCQFASGVNLNADQLAVIISDLQEYIDRQTESRIPVMIHEEAITGIAAKGATVTPQMIGMSCSWEPELVCENARMTAQNMKKMGCYYALSPMMDVITDARWGRGEEGYGADVLLVTAFSQAFIKGLQEEGAAATAKHFAGYGVENQEMDFFWNEVLLPFESAVKTGNVQAVMPGYHSFHGVPCTASGQLLTEILRDKWRFDGLIVSDYGAVSNIYRHHHAVSNLKEAAIAALEAGVDVEFPSGECFPLLVEAVREGRISEERIDQSVYRVLSLKNKLGLLERVKSSEGTDKIDLDPPEFRKQALESARKSVVLLKNDGILPLKDSKYKISVIGPNADSYYAMLGDYTWSGIIEFFYHKKGSREDPEIITLLQGIQNRFSKCTVQYERGCDWITMTDRVSGTPMGDARGEDAGYMPLEDIPFTNWNRAIQLGKESDLIIAAVGENRYLCGECCDRENVKLPGEQEKLVSELCSLGKPVVMVVFGGRPMAIGEIAEKCSAVLYAWYPGEEGGNAIADILKGTTIPSGKLTVTLPDKNEDVPVFYQQGEKAEKCRYPFGFGMSYTTFEYSDLKIPKEVSIEQKKFELQFCITNTGSLEGAEIVQIYTSSRNGSKKLIGFTRVELNAGQSQIVNATFYPENFARYDAQGELHLYPQEVSIKIGASSADIRMEAHMKIIGEEKRLQEHTHFLPDFSKAETAKEL